ncbi:MAG TPA: SemiSWEET transporter [Methanomicrobiales archaeon]|nr:SemiSWEET transporter [Methanomicrobiales archaeon]
MDTSTLIGFLAGGLTTASFLPQVMKTAKSRSARDISGAMLLVFLVGLCLWTAYGIQTGSSPLIITNLATIALVGAILGMKLRFGNRECECTVDEVP